MFDLIAWDHTTVVDVLGIEEATYYYKLVGV